MQSFNEYISWKDKNLQLQFVREIKSRKGNQYFSGPFGVSLGSDGRIYIADDLAHRILVFDKSKELLETIGKRGNRPGDFAWVDAVAVDRAGNLYSADTGNDRVQILDNKHNVKEHFGKRSDKPDFLKNPRGIALDKNNRIYVADWGNHRIQVFNVTGNVLT